MNPDRFFGPDPTQKQIALRLYESVAGLPLVCPHGHVEAKIFVNPDYSFGDPVDLFIIPDHYVFRMLHSQGIALEALGISPSPPTPLPEGEGRLPSPQAARGEVERDHRKIWQLFAENFFLFRGTPTGLWLAYEFEQVFGIQEKLSGANAQRLYDLICEKLAQPEFRPRALFERFNIEALATTDAASDPLQDHQALRASGWPARILPTFRPDGVINLDDEGWGRNLQALGQACGVEIRNYATYIQVLEERRAFFKGLGAAAADHAVQAPYTCELSVQEAERIFDHTLCGQITAEEARRFVGHMLVEMARMSVEDGLVMQLHPGSLRNHSPLIYQRFGRDKGADIPLATEFTRNLQPLLSRFGHDPRLTLILFTLDETTYSRELAPLAGFYPAVKLGPPWWFHDSLNGMQRFFEQVMETAGIYNTVGFNDDTRAFLSIPARHDLWRRAACNWLAGLAARGVVDEEDAHEMAYDLAYRLPKIAYKL